MTDWRHVVEYLNKARDRWLDGELGGGQEEP